VADGRRPARPSPLARAVAALVLCACTLVALPALGTPTASAQQGATTTTLPVGRGDIGDIIPKPNSGHEPEHPGDRGGWQQITLFFLLIAALATITGLVWWSSRRARRRREEAGLDPLSIARARGEGVRRPPDQSARRSTRSEPVEDSSTKRPDSSAGR